MPITRCQIAFVESEEIRKSFTWVRIFEVYTVKPYTSRGHQRLATDCQFTASLCEQAAKQGRELVIEWRWTGWIPEIVSASLAQEEGAA